MQNHLFNPSPSVEQHLPRKWVWSAAIAVALFYALLWSPWWYPLSDSALYLNMARSLMQGKGWNSLRQLHRDVTPATPLLLFAIMKLGGGIGAMHAMMIGLMLAAHTLTFLTLRRWFNERLALLATLATASSWWVYANAFTIMTEPLFLVMFWASMLTLSYLGDARPARQWVLVIVATLLMAVAWENRVAAILLIPGMLFGLWMSHRDVDWKARAGWIAVFVLVFAVLLWAYRRPIPGAEVAAKNEEVYHLNFFVGIKNYVVDLPVSAGRWVIEGLAAAGAVPFEMSSKVVRIVASFGAVLTFGVACVGWCRLWRGRHWYAIGMAFYFLPIFAQWGARIKPRYMTPIAPILFIQLCYGISGSLPPRSTGGGGDRIGIYLFVILFLMNAVPYGVEWYVRHGTSLNFYDVSRQGAYAELVDIGGYVQKHAPSDAVVSVNWPPPSSRPPDATFAPDRRIVQFLCNRDVRFMRPFPDSGEDPEKLGTFFSQVEGNWAVVYESRLRWPSYHLPLARPSIEPRWWRLYRRELGSDRFEPVRVPRDRDYVRTVPGLER